MSWYLDSNNKLTHNDLPEPIDGDIFKYPYPASFWNLNNNILTLNSEDWIPFPEPIYDILTPPYPASFWYLNERSKLQNNILPKRLAMGAFARTTELQEIRLPESLEEIGPEAFADSSIKQVIIPNNTCVYYSTSFPPDCIVTGGHLKD